MAVKRRLMLALTLMTMSVSSYLSASSTVLPPVTVDGYLNSSDVIVLGRIGPVVSVHTFYGYQNDAAERERIDDSTSMSSGVPMVDYEVIVDEVISTDGYYREDAGEPLVIRVMRDHDRLDETEVIQDSGTFLFFLSRNPDDATYGFFSFGHKVNVDDDERPKYYFGGEYFDILDGNMSSHELIAEVRERISERI